MVHKKPTDNVTRSYLQQIYLLLKRLLVCYLAYQACRVLFFVANRTYFPETGIGAFLSDCFYGLRFDTFSIMVGNSLFILLSILPGNFVWRNWYQKLLQWIFGITNALFLLVNCIDIGYFPFTKKRAGLDLVKQATGQTDLGKLLPRYLLDFWWLLLCYILMVVLLIMLYKRIKAQTPAKMQFSFKQLPAVALLFVLVVGFAVLGIRGGLQRIPIDIVNAGTVASAEGVPLVLNTPFTLIKSVEKKPLQDYHFYDDSQLKAIYDPLHQYKDSLFKKQNVVVVILESFSKEYTKLGRTRSITPFLDSLMDHSLVFSNAFSNGSKSIEGIPAILASLPSLMENPFINSVYANNAQTTFANVLSSEGYETAFFHGGINGTMNFDNWASLAGYQHYYGKNEYNNDADFDGYWGIWDEPFLQYTAKKISTFKQPFHAAVFTLSSHHPYFVPEKYKGKFPKTHLENSECIGYADYALRKFFISAAQQPWYHNTLFVLTADHASLSEHPFFSNPVGNLTIPILFYKPGNTLQGDHEQAFSQIDILPSVLQLMGYNKPFFAFGESAYSGKPHNNYFYANGGHYLCEDSMLFEFSEAKLHMVANYKRDSTLSVPLLNTYPVLDSLESRRFRAFLQTYNHTLIYNQGSVK